MRVSSSGSGSASSTFLILVACSWSGRKSATAAAITTASQASAAAITASRSSAAVCTRTVVTPATSGSTTFALTRVTAAPRSAAARAMRVSLPAGGTVAKEAHRVERLLRTAGGNDDLATGEIGPAHGCRRRRSSEHRTSNRGDFKRLRQPARAGVGTGEASRRGLERRGRPRSRKVATLARVAGVQPHLGVHGGAKTTRAAWRSAGWRSAGRRRSPAPPGPAGRPSPERPERGRRRGRAGRAAPHRPRSRRRWRRAGPTARPRSARRRIAAPTRWERP